jgi:hypothetical protein
MLSGPPPGYNAPAMNDQTINTLSQPGPQGLVAQGSINPNYYKSSYATPSSYMVPSSVDVPNPYYSQPLHPNAQMARALGKVR